MKSLKKKKVIQLQVRVPKTFMGYSVVSPDLDKLKPSSLSGQRVTKILGTAVFFGKSGNMDLGVDFTSEMGL